ncbi:MAG: CoA transferase [Chloroflexi bacterium]|nr:CoA transferase [Chloroflexota bacterium]
MVPRESRDAGTPPTALGPYRVLDLTEGGYNLGPRLLGDLGADVLRIEPPEGSPTRRLGPFLGHAPHPEKSLFWRAYNFNKRGITLGLETADGRDLLRRLVQGADFLFESFPPGYLPSLGLGYPDLAAITPRLIMASVTPFGQTGPYAHYQATDLVLWAMGGYLWMCGDPDRPPVRVGLPPQTAFHASASAAAASLIALQARHATGRGQQIDQSAQQCPPWMLTHTYQWYEYEGVILQREGRWRQFGTTRIRTVYPCKDGLVVAVVAGGFVGSRSNRLLTEVMAREGLAPDWLLAIDWGNYDARKVSQPEVDRLTEAFTAYFRTKTKAELLDLAVREGLFIAPLNTLADVLTDPQLQARGYWVVPPDAADEVALKYPGAPFVMEETPWQMRRPAPRIGQHNLEVYHGELGLFPRDLELLKAGGAM